MYYFLIFVDIICTYIQVLVLFVLIGFMREEKLLLENWKKTAVILFFTTIFAFLSANWVVSDPWIRVIMRAVSHISIYYALYSYYGDLLKSMVYFTFFMYLSAPLAVGVLLIFETNTVVEGQYLQLASGLIATAQFALFLQFFKNPKRKSYVDFINKFIEKIKYFIYLLIIVEISLTVILAGVGQNILDFKTITAYYLYPVSSVLFFSILFLLFNRLKEVTLRLDNQVNNLTEYTNTVEELYKDMRCYKHDMNNILLSLKYAVIEKDMASIETFYMDNIDGFKGFNLDAYDLIAKLDNLKVNELKGVLISKYSAAKNNAVHYDVSIQEKVDVINIESVDLCRMVGIILDNAIEAASNIEDGYVYLLIEPKGDHILIKVVNNYNPLSMNKSKGKNRGIGLKSIKRIIKKYPLVSLNTIINHETYTQVIDIE